MPIDFDSESTGFAAKAPRLRIWHFWLVSALVILLVGLVVTLRFGGYLLVALDPLPEQAQVAVVLAGSPAAEEKRRAEALSLMQRGIADYTLLSVGKFKYLGQWVPHMVSRYVENKYGTETAQRVVLCEMNADSTREEALALRRCLESQGWRSIIVVTSNYHTRRARLIWEATLAEGDPPFSLTVHGVWDGEFNAKGWWRSRRFAKTWLLEFTKLVWTWVFGPGGLF